MQSTDLLNSYGDLIHGHMLVDVRLRPGPGVIDPPQPTPHRHAAEGATPAPESDQAGHGEATAGSSFGVRHDDGVRPGA